MRVIVMCESELSDFDVEVLRSIRMSDHVIVGALVNSKKKSGALRRIRRELGKGRGGYVLIQILKNLERRLRPVRATKAEDFLKEIPTLRTDDLCREEVHRWVRSLNPDCLLLRGFGLVRQPMLSIAPYGILSYHHGDMHYYRGGPPAFWELYNNEKSIGVTVQILDEGLDTGTIVVQKFFQIHPTDNWGRLVKRIYDGSTTLAVEALNILSEKEPFRSEVGPAGRLYTLPNFTQWLTLQLRILKRKIQT